ncbi:hypothetical protein ACJX0J_032572, partial [Zea mays]
KLVHEPEAHESTIDREILVNSKHNSITNSLRITDPEFHGHQTSSFGTVFAEYTSTEPTMVPSTSQSRERQVALCFYVQSPFPKHIIFSFLGKGNNPCGRHDRTASTTTEIAPQTNRHERLGFKRKEQKKPKRTLVWRTGQCPVPRAVRLQTYHLRVSEEALRYNSPNCPMCHRTASWFEVKSRKMCFWGKEGQVPWLFYAIQVII